MSDRPEAMRKYIAPSPRPVTVRRMKVSITCSGPAARDAEELTQQRGIAEQLRGRPGVDDAPLVEDDHVARERLDDAEVLLDEQDRLRLAHPLERACDLRDEERREALRRLVDEQDPVVVEQRPCDRDHLLLAARERARPLCCPLAKLGEEVVDEVVAGRAVPNREAQVLLDGEPGEDVAVLGHVADAAAHDPVGRQLADLLAAERDPPLRRREPHQRAQASSSCRRRCGRAAQ